MNIINDQIEIEPSDIAALSPELQAAVTFRAGPQTTPHEYLSARFNAVLEESSLVHIKDLLASVENISLAVAKADAATQDAVKTLVGIPL